MVFATRFLHRSFSPKKQTKFLSCSLRSKNSFQQESYPFSCIERKASTTCRHAHGVGNEIDIISASDCKTYYVETYGCQMNVNDSDIVRSILNDSGYEEVKVVDEAATIFINTCAIRDNAESRVWQRLKFFRSVGQKRRYQALRRQRIAALEKSSDQSYSDLKVGILGCMAERLKEKLLEGNLVDLVAGPDAYRDLPRLIELVYANSNDPVINVQLSQDETYAEINPIRRGSNVDAYVSIMRGCNNMCSYCIVPFTRGRERSRPLQRIVDEVKYLSDEGVKEVMLLGQNVNSYCDKSTPLNRDYFTASGFSNLYKSRGGFGAYFADLLLAVSEVDPEMRIRFTSPHPKDFPDSVLQVISSRANICKQLHLPAQSGSTLVLSAMRRGYSREAYLDLVANIRSIIPDVCLSSDFIAGFCTETEEDHRQTLSLMKEVQYDQAFMYAYSAREKTHAARSLADKVPEFIKQKRLSEIIETFREAVVKRNIERELYKVRLVLVEGLSRRSKDEHILLTGRTDGNKRVIFPRISEVPGSIDDYIIRKQHANPLVHPVAGDYVLVYITEVFGHTLRGKMLCKTTICEHDRLFTDELWDFKSIGITDYNVQLIE